MNTERNDGKGGPAEATPPRSQATSNELDTTPLKVGRERHPAPTTARRKTVMLNGWQRVPFEVLEATVVYLANQGKSQATAIVFHAECGQHHLHRVADLDSPVVRRPACRQGRYAVALPESARWVA